MEQYRYLATTLGGFMQQLSVCYVERGYWFYVTGFIPERTTPEKVDEKLLSLYDIRQSKMERLRRKRRGLANLQYLRYGRHFVLLATPGEHLFFERERDRVKDSRRQPLRLFGYSVGLTRDGRLRVGIDSDALGKLRASFLEESLSRKVTFLANRFSSLPYEPYRFVRAELLGLLKRVNQRRKRAGLPLVSTGCIRKKRRIYRPFETSSLLGASTASKRVSLETS